MYNRASLALLASTMLALSSSTNAQTAGPMRVGVMGGLNSSTVGGAAVGDTDRLTGLIGGAYVITPLTKAAALRTELLYSQKGSQVLITYVGTSLDIDITTDFVEVPVLMQYEFGSTTGMKPHVYAGPSFGLNVRCQWERVREGTKLSLDCNDIGFDLRPFELGGVLGAGFTFPVGQRLGTAGARYQHGLTDTYRGMAVRNRVLSLYVGLDIGKRR